MIKMNKNWTRIVRVACLAALIVGLVVSGFAHSNTLKTNKALENSNKTLALELNNNRAMLSVAQNELDIAKNKLNLAKEDLRIETEKTAELTEQTTGLNNELSRLQTEFDNITEQLEIANTTMSDLKDQEYKLVYLGDYKLTHYCPGFHGAPCGTGDGLTATGTKVTPGRTIAVDPKVIPYGTKVYIEGYGWRVAEDCGGSVKGNHIDVATGSHDEAMSSGVKHRGVWMLVKNES